MSIAPNHGPADLHAIQQRLANLHPRKIDLTLGRMHRILDALGHPERRIPPVIHVAGTNGKGSTVAFLRAILESAGLKVHTFTSPHLVRINERYRLGQVGGGKFVSDEELSAALAHCEKVNKGEPITVFEIETAAGFWLFAEHAADVTLLEVGLGGRLDATNVIDTPLASVITPVSMDHLDFLGNTLAAIAGEKAGIIKQSVPVIIGPQTRDAEEVIERRARLLRAPMHSAGQDWHVSIERGRLVYQDERGLIDLPAPKLFGRHQFDNAGLAIATLRAIDQLQLPAAAFEAGVTKAEWPARMQRLKSGALVKLAPEGAEVWLDGGHNADGGRVVAAALGDLEERAPKPLVLILGMMSNKDAAGFLGNFAGLTRHVIAVPIPGQDNAFTAERLAETLRPVGLRVETSDSVAAALSAVAKLAYEIPPRILITGSLYLAGHVLEENGTLPQ